MPAVLVAGLLLSMGFLGTASTVSGAPSGSPSSTLSQWIVTGSRSIVLRHGAPGALDAVAVFAPSLVRALNGSFLIYYTGYDGYQDHVMEAWSANGTTWTRVGEAVSLNSGNAGPFAMVVGSTYHLWFESIIWGVGPLGYLDQIYHATSSDGLNWSTPVLALGIGNSGAWDGGAVVDPAVVQDAGGTYRMYYTMAATNRSGAVGVATSPDLETWTKWSGNPVLLPGRAGAWDDAGVGAPSVVAGSSWTLFFQGRQSGTGYRIGIASSADGYAWTPNPHPLLANGTGGGWDSYEVANPAFFGGSSAPRLVFDGSTGPYQNTIAMVNLTTPGGATSATIFGLPVPFFVAIIGFVGVAVAAVVVLGFVTMKGSRRR